MGLMTIGEIGRSEIIEALRALVAATGHESAGPNRCAFLTKGCTCGKIEEQRVALANANRILIAEARVTVPPPRLDDLFPAAQSPDEPFGWVKFAWQQNRDK